MVVSVILKFETKIHRNLIIDHLKRDTSRTVATLDLGGGSLQITFVPHTTERIVKEAPGHLYEVSILNKKVKTYSYRYLNINFSYPVIRKYILHTIRLFSYLGLGLMAARRRAFLSENSENSTNLISSCVNPVVQEEVWYYGVSKFSVKYVMIV